MKTFCTSLFIFFVLNCSKNTNYYRKLQVGIELHYYDNYYFLLLLEIFKSLHKLILFVILNFKAFLLIKSHIVHLILFAEKKINDKKY